VEYKKGKENSAVDALSRKFSSILAISAITPTWMYEMINSYSADDHTKTLVQKFILPPKPQSDYTMHARVFKYKGRLVIGQDQTLQTKLLSALHKSAIEGHSGIRATYQRIKKLFYWPGLKKAVESFVSQCSTCQRSKHENCKYPRLLDPLPRPNMAWSHITINFIEALPKSQGNEVILVAVDKFTKYAHFISLSHPYTINSVVQAVMDHVIKLHGPPTVIISDRDRIFTSTMWKAVFKDFKVELRFSSAYHP
jgi:hypothetical protein